MNDILDSLNYVSRGGQKLARALNYFNVSPKGRVCIDCGASTGGFTDCLLQKGARFVYAIDVGYGQLAWILRNDPRVKVMERTNIRYVTPDMLISNDGINENKPSLAVIDVSFISLSLVLPVIHKLLCAGAASGETAISPEVIALIKPQFEAGKGKVGKGGIVRDPGIHKEVLHKFKNHAGVSGFTVSGITHSPVKGPKGNIEYLGYLTISANAPAAEICIDAIVAGSHKELDV